MQSSSVNSKFVTDPKELSDNPRKKMRKNVLEPVLARPQNSVRLEDSDQDDCSWLLVIQDDVEGKLCVIISRKALCCLPCWTLAPIWRKAFPKWGLCNSPFYCHASMMWLTVRGYLIAKSVTKGASHGGHCRGVNNLGVYRVDTCSVAAPTRPLTLCHTVSFVSCRFPLISNK